MEFRALGLLGFGVLGLSGCEASGVLGLRRTQDASRLWGSFVLKL